MHNWNVSLNKGDTHPICVELEICGSSGAIRLDLQIEEATKMGMFLVGLWTPGKIIKSRGGWCTAAWDTKCLGGAQAIIATDSAYTALSKYSAAQLAYKIEQVIREAKLDGEPENKPDFQSVDSLGGPLRRTDDNLRRVFG